MRAASAVINLCFSSDVIGGMASLKHVERSPHVSLRELQQCLSPFFRYLHASSVFNVRLFCTGKGNSLFSLNDMVKFLLHLGDRVRREPEARASTLHRRDDLVDVVTNDAKPDVLGILFYHATQSCLGCGSHHVCFIEDDQFEAR